jgi:hypothetical protein
MGACVIKPGKTGEWIIYMGMGMHLQSIPGALDNV